MESTLGTDPEVCVLDKDGQIVPSGWCFDVWQKTMPIIEPPPAEEGRPPKGRKLALTNLGDGFYLYEDGASLEFNLPPTRTAHEMVENLRAILFEADRLTKEAGFVMEIKASLPITKEVIERGGVALSQFGCDPDSTPWDDPYDPSKIDATACYRRYYGGHIHIGAPGRFDTEFFYDFRWEMTLACDIFMGLVDVLIDHSEEAKARRQVYGRIGRNRVQRYDAVLRGYEYRVPSNGWLRNPETTELMFKLGQLAFYLTANYSMDDATYQEMLHSIPLDNLKNAINNTNPEMAGSILMGRVAQFLKELSENDPYVASLNITLGLAFANSDLDWRTAWFGA